MSTIQWKVAKTYSDITYHKADGIAKVTINRPEKRNAFRPETAQMFDAFCDAREDPTIGVVLLTGAGRPGRQVRLLLRWRPERARPCRLYRRRWRAAPQRPRSSETDPLDAQGRIALVAGYAIGGGHVLHLVYVISTDCAADNGVFGQVGPRQAGRRLWLQLPRASSARRRPVA